MYLLARSIGWLHPKKHNKAGAMKQWNSLLFALQKSHKNFLAERIGKRRELWCGWEMLMEAKARRGKGKSSFLIWTEKRNGKVFVWWIMEEAETEAKKVLILLWAIWSLNTINLVSWNSARNQRDKINCQMKKGKLLLIKRFSAANKKLFWFYFALFMQRW